MKERPRFESECIPGVFYDCDACHVTKRFDLSWTVSSLQTCHLSRSIVGTKIQSKNFRGELPITSISKKVLSSGNTSFCYWDNDDKQFLSEAEVDAEDLEDGLVYRINLGREWALGQTCHGLSTYVVILILDRAEVAHYFYHWRFNLREEVKTALEEINYFSPEKIEYIKNLPSELQYE
jgi:hypothetical protein